MKTLFYLIILIAIGVASYLHLTQPEKHLTQPEKFAPINNAIVMDQKSGQVVGAIAEFSDGKYIVTNQLFLPALVLGKRTLINGKGIKININTEKIEISESLDIARLKYQSSSKFDQDTTYKLLKTHDSYDIPYTLYGTNQNNKLPEYEAGTSWSSSLTMMQLSKNHSIQLIGALIISNSNKLVGIGTSTQPGSYGLASFYVDMSTRLKQNRVHKNYGAIVNENTTWITKDGTKYATSLSKLEDWHFLVALCEELHQYERRDDIDNFYNNSFIKYLYSGLKSSSSKKQFFKKMYINYSKLLAYNNTNYHDYYRKSIEELIDAQKNIKKYVSNHKSLLRDLSKELKKIQTTNPYLKRQIEHLGESIVSIQSDHTSTLNDVKDTYKKISNRLEQLRNSEERTNSYTKALLKREKSYLTDSIKNINKSISDYKDKLELAKVRRDKEQINKFIKTPSTEMKSISSILKRLYSDKSAAIKKIRTIEAKLIK